MDANALAARIAALSNAVVKNNAEQIFNLAQQNEDTQLLEILDNLLNSSASRDGTAIFYSDKDHQNFPNKGSALQCHDQLGEDNAYLFEHTAAGQYLENKMLDLILEGVTLPTGADTQLFNLGSSMMADQAGSNVIAFVDGASSNSTWIQHEPCGNVDVPHSPCSCSDLYFCKLYQTVPYTNFLARTLQRRNILLRAEERKDHLIDSELLKVVT